MELAVADAGVAAVQQGQLSASQPVACPLSRGRTSPRKARRPSTGGGLWPVAEDLAGAAPGVSCAPPPSPDREHDGWQQACKRARTAADVFRPSEPAASQQQKQQLAAAAAASTDDSGTDTDDEAAAALLLGIVGAGGVVPSSQLPSAAPVPRRKRSATHRASAAWTADRLLDVPMPGADGVAALSHLVCTQCRQPVTLSGERRPTFVCGTCRSKNGSHKRAQRALLAADPSVTVTVQQALEAGGSTHAAAAAAVAAPEESQSLNSSKDADTYVTGRDGDSSDGGASPRAPAARSAAPSPQAESEGPDAGDGSHGRCKCGKRIAPNHPPCKSELMLLCEKFQSRFGGLDASGRPQQIMLKDAVTELGVSRRRLYDIINVLEAVEIVRRTGKLTYEWRGVAHLPALLQRLFQEEALGLPVEERLKRTPPAATEQAAAVAACKEEVRTQHTLWALSRKFVRVLLTRKGPLPLTDVATLLMADAVDAQRRNQTQITIERRLYDIGSILTAVGLIEKTYLGKRQPAFMWKLPWNEADQQRQGRAGTVDVASQPSSPALQPLPPAPPALLPSAAHWVGPHVSAPMWPAALPDQAAAAAAAAAAGLFMVPPFGMPPQLSGHHHPHLHPSVLLPPGFGGVAALLHPSMAAAGFGHPHHHHTGMVLPPPGPAGHARPAMQ